jgi:hypothetical protein
MIEIFNYKMDGCKHTENIEEVRVKQRCSSTQTVLNYSRKDYSGNIISRKLKKHHITFADSTNDDSKQLAEVIIVKSYTSGKSMDL